MMLLGYGIYYIVSVVLFFFAIGALLLPIGVFGFPILIYIVWKRILKHAENKTLKIVFLLGAYMVFIFITYILDSISWNEGGNLAMYLSWLGIEVK
ncbi:hypothetical protein BK139_08530 [Paenibacillus sp. FSL R5-0490]|uniref:hypothetical protein n=1 Tax=Paenibacillus sp. FSL R5-0490 TaxID=1920424 RepID=UPI00096E1A09|nr:hypothetical protein [Paenibacillus sp. FSL R5-0490]OMF60903.1 hypothetical protein BK139_08530 [Paenibacillus sp. FSL R5-0490]